MKVMLFFTLIAITLLFILMNSSIIFTMYYFKIFEDKPSSYVLGMSTLIIFIFILLVYIQLTIFHIIKNKLILYEIKKQNIKRNPILEII